MDLLSDRIKNPVSVLICSLVGPSCGVQVEGLLDRAAANIPVIQYVVEQFERLGYQSWAHRILNTAGEKSCSTQ